MPQAFTASATYPTPSPAFILARAAPPHPQDGRRPY